MSLAVTQTQTKGQFRLSRRGRQIRTAVVLALLITGGNAVAQFNSAQASGTSTITQVHFKYATVRSGESLWQLAERYAPNQDPRDFIADVVSLNQLKSSEVTPGQRIALPNK